MRTVFFFQLAHVLQTHIEFEPLKIIECIVHDFCSKSWVNIYCVLKEGKLTFYKDAKNLTATYNGEPSVDMSDCKFDPSMGYKKKKNVFILQ